MFSFPEYLWSAVHKITVPVKYCGFRKTLPDRETCFSPISDALADGKTKQWKHVPRVFMFPLFYSSRTSEECITLKYCFFAGHYWTDVVDLQNLNPDGPLEKVVKYVSQTTISFKFAPFHLPCSAELYKEPQIYIVENFKQLSTT